VRIERRRAAVVIVDGGRVAVIERRSGDELWYLLPGGGVEAGESFEQAAAREAREELGLEVAVGPLLAEVRFARPDGTGSLQRYFAGDVTGGEFGTGDGPEYHLPPDWPRGTYRPTWLVLDGMAVLDVRPPELFRRLALGGVAGLGRDPLMLEERGR
jgi:8-oxo-dGTP diphosphatase